MFQGLLLTAWNQIVCKKKYFLRIMETGNKLRGFDVLKCNSVVCLDGVW